MFVICFYWEGDRWNSNPKDLGDPSYRAHMKRAGASDLSLASQYVNNLFEGVKTHTTVPFDFVCFTNEDLTLHKHIDKRPFPLHTDVGVLPRVYMFSPEAGLENRQVLCLDLDVIIVGDMDPIMKYRGRFCARSKFKPGETHKLDGDVMSFRAGQETSMLFFDPFIANVEKAVAMTQGRERYWVRHVADRFAERWENVAPGSVLSYKRHLRGRKSLPKGAAIVSCHGTPRPHQINEPWIKRYWGTQKAGVPNDV